MIVACPVCSWNHSTRLHASTAEGSAIAETCFRLDRCVASHCHDLQLVGRRRLSNSTGTNLDERLRALETMEVEKSAGDSLEDELVHDQLVYTRFSRVYSLFACRACPAVHHEHPQGSDHG